MTTQGNSFFFWNHRTIGMEVGIQYLQIYKFKEIQEEIFQQVLMLPNQIKHSWSFVYKTVKKTQANIWNYLFYVETSFWLRKLIW